MSEKLIIDRFCPKCCSNRVYVDGEMFACRTCGNRWLPNYKPYKKVEEEPMALDKDKLMELHGEGKTDNEIAEAIGQKLGTVWAARKKLGLKPNKPATAKTKKPCKPITKKFVAVKFKPSGDVESVENLVAVDDGLLIDAMDKRITFHERMAENLKKAKSLIMAV